MGKAKKDASIVSDLSRAATLLVYENTGTGLSMYLLPAEEADKYRHVLETCQEKFVNSDEWKDEFGILGALISEESMYVDEQFEEHACRWAGLKISTKTPATVFVGKIYYSGFCD